MVLLFSDYRILVSFNGNAFQESFHRPNNRGDCNACGARFHIPE